VPVAGRDFERVAVLQHLDGLLRFVSEIVDVLGQPLDRGHLNPELAGELPTVAVRFGVQEPPDLVLFEDVRLVRGNELAVVALGMVDRQRDAVPTGSGRLNLAEREESPVQHTFRNRDHRRDEIRVAPDFLSPDSVRVGFDLDVQKAVVRFHRSRPDEPVRRRTSATDAGSVRRSRHQQSPVGESNPAAPRECPRRRRRVKKRTSSGRKRGGRVGVAGGELNPPPPRGRRALRVVPGSRSRVTTVAGTSPAGGRTSTE